MAVALLVMAVIVGVLVVRLFRKNDELREKSEVIVSEVRRNQKLIERAVEHGVSRAAMLFSFLAVILTFGLGLTACEVDDSPTDTEEYKAQIANTRWQMAAVVNQNNEWVEPEFYPGMDIPELSFGIADTYYMKIIKGYDRSVSTLINGSYHIDGSFSISMTDDNYQGIAYTLKVRSLSGQTLEGEFIVWGVEQRTYDPDGNGITTTYQPRHYTIRLKQMNQ